MKNHMYDDLYMVEANKNTNLNTEKKTENTLA